MSKGCSKPTITVYLTLPFSQGDGIFLYKEYPALDAGFRKC